SLSVVVLSVVGVSPTLTTWNVTVIGPPLGLGSGDATSCAATRSTHNEQALPLVIVVVCVLVLLPSFVSTKALDGSIVAVRLTDGGRPVSRVMKLTVIVVLPPAGRLPLQSSMFDTGPVQVKPFDPAALRNVTPAVGRSTSMWTPVAPTVPPLTATIVYLSP